MTGVIRDATPVIPSWNLRASRSVHSTSAANPGLLQPARDGARRCSHSEFGEAERSKFWLFQGPPHRSLNVRAVPSGRHTKAVVSVVVSAGAAAAQPGAGVPQSSRRVSGGPSWPPSHGWSQQSLSFLSSWQCSSPAAPPRTALPVHLFSLPVRQVTGSEPNLS